MSKVPYFKATEIAPRTWQIEYAFSSYSPVYCYLTEGKDYALLIDTMNGYGNLHAFCRTLTDKPIKLVNTHFHFDHTLGNFDFDSCYMHPSDIPYFYDFKADAPEQMLEQAKARALPEYRDLLAIEEMSAPRDMRVYPVYDGDVFDLGDRQITVVDVGGHSPGSIVLIDPVLRIAFTGDACNGNTLLSFGNALSVERYLHNLLHFKRFQPQFDMMYGGHQVLKPETIDEAIELCGKVLAGSDDKEERIGLFGKSVIYAAKHADEGIGRADGKSFNICYDPQKIYEGEKEPQTITLQPASMF